MKTFEGKFSSKDNFDKKNMSIVLKEIMVVPWVL